ncbi:hypothetical protein BRC87_09805 [Halobacteriales archaeon QS_4_66_20]|nr:MAG: hypothetical protein BRC87_09805 [Halobacteriales archaeon QS_4_66_20]
MLIYRKIADLILLKRHVTKPSLIMMSVHMITIQTITGSARMICRHQHNISFGDLHRKRLFTIPLVMNIILSGQMKKNSGTYYKSTKLDSIYWKLVRMN